MKNGFQLPNWVQGLMLLAMVATGSIWTYYDKQNWLAWSCLILFGVWFIYFIYRIIFTKVKGGKNGK